MSTPQPRTPSSPSELTLSYDDDLTVAAAARVTAQGLGRHVAIRTPDDTSSLTWDELLERSDRFAGGLSELGVQAGDVVAAMLINRPEFAIADLATLTLGAASFSLYATLPPEQIAQQLANSGARVVVTEPTFLDVVLAARELTATVNHVVVLDDARHDGTIAWSDVEARGDGFDGSASAAAVALDDLATLIYTSGTTGPAKGVELTHRNILESARIVNSVVGLAPGDRVISWLPNAHIAERLAHYYLPLFVGVTVTCCEDPKLVATTLSTVRPRWFFAVPRVWEKLRAGLDARVVRMESSERELVLGALARQTERVRLRQRGAATPVELDASAGADRAIVARLRAGLGLDDASCLQAGAAPCPREVVEFFHALELPLTEIWGMSETSAAGTMGRADGHRIGTVGRALPGVELRLEDDGELLIRGPVVMRGYRGQPEETAEVLHDGWLSTGDIAEIDADGFVTIVDRKKELIINAAGKNMSPANIEAALRSAGPLIGQACVIGDRRPYNVALLVLDPDTAPAWAAEAGLGEHQSTAVLAGLPEIVEAVAVEVEQANTKLARVEQIKRFHIVETDWLPGGAELTPTMKLKRKPIAERYRANIDALYPAR